MEKRSTAILKLAAAGFVGGVVIHSGYAWVNRSASSDQKVGNELLIQALLEDGKSFRGEDKKQLKTSAQTLQSQQSRQTKTKQPFPGHLEPKPPIALSIRVALLSINPLRSLRLQGDASCYSKTGIQLSSDQLNIVLEKPDQGPIHCKTQKKGRIIVNGRPYEQQIAFLVRENGWLAVNQLELERYVASVVGAEMPSHWHQEALKAQAVAARSYALAHMARPADSDFDLGDTTRWQAYGGLFTQTSKSLDATDATQGIVLSYKGGIVESLYAATASISYEAHRHLGASMSQHGAQDKANQGLKFNEILGAYYVGAALARLQNHDN